LFIKLRSNKIPKNYKVNENIRVPSVLVIDETGEQLGEIKTEVAIDMATDRGLDLVEVASTATPPVCRFLNYGKFRYDASRKEKESKKSSKASTHQLREVRMKTRIGEHDRQSKTRMTKRLLAEGSKVKVSIIFRGREVQHPQIGMELLKNVAEDLQEDAVIDSPPKFEGRFLAMILSPSAALKKISDNKEIKSAKT